MDVIASVGSLILLVALILASPFLVLIAFLAALLIPAAIIDAILCRPLESVLVAIAAAALYLQLA